jgi:hypothetical protein
MACGVQDPGNQLPSLEWETRERFLQLGAALCRQTGGRYFLRVRPSKSGRRTCAEQNAIYAQGRSTPGDVVTQARGCQSWHVLGRAVDADVVDGQTGTMASEALYAAAGALWKSAGGTWGGSFPGFPDIGHFEWHPGVSLSTTCPVPEACSDNAVDTIGISWWAWPLATCAVLGAAGYLFWDDLTAVARRARLVLPR